MRRSRPRPAPGPKTIADLGFAQLDLSRHARQGYPEIVYGAGKTPAQLVTIAHRLYAAENFFLITRASAEAAALVRQELPQSRWHATARIITCGRLAKSRSDRRFVAVIAAGTSDLPVAEEAAVTLEAFAIRVKRVYDVGVAGLHRLLAQDKILRGATTLIVVAGMEGALPSVVGGLVAAPVIAVPTSVGYGANFQGLSALLGMLTSCASGLTVVNIDNGFGAAFAAARILGISSKRQAKK